MSPLRPADLRKAVADWAAQGFIVQIAPNGAITVTPPQAKPTTDPFDLVDLRK